jgi:hypothetical protein
MKLVIVDVQLTEDDPEPEAKLDEGEFIVKRIVEIKDLWKTLEGEVVIEVEAGDSVAFYVTS